MSAGTRGALLRRLLLAADQKAADQSDLQLLEGFVARKDEAAFAALMQRHGQLVFRVCRAVLEQEQEQDAEDAFQATFLVLARLASRIRKRNSLASWLHGVALRTALKARQAMHTRHRLEARANMRTAEQPVAEAALRELQAMLHEEVGRLVEKYRAPFVLFCLEGKTRLETAQELGWKEGTVASRVAEARKLLESRLLRRGVALPAALTAAACAPAVVSAGVPLALARGAVTFAAGNVPETVSREAVTLAQGVVKAMSIAKLKMVATVALLLTLILGGGSLLAYPAWQSEEHDNVSVAPPPKIAEQKPAPAAPPVNELVDEGVIQQIGDKVPFGRGILVERAKQGNIVYYLAKEVVIVHANQQPAKAADLKVGMKVRVHTDGSEYTTDPPLAEAQRIVILDAAGKDAPAGAGNGLEAPLPPGAVARFGTTRFRTGQAVGSLKLSPDGKKLITGGLTSGRGLFVWEAATGKLLLHRPGGQYGEVTRDGQRLLVIEPLPGSRDGPDVNHGLSIYQLSSGKLVQQIQDPRSLMHFALAPDERTLALQYAVPDGKVLVETPQIEVDMKQKVDVPADVRTSWTYLFKPRLVLYDLKAGRVLHDLGELPRPYNNAGLIRFSRDSKILFAISCSPENQRNESTFRRFDVATGKLKSKKVIDVCYLQPPVQSDSTTPVVSGGMIWDLEQERPRWISKGNLEGIFAFLPDGRTIIGWAKDEKLINGKTSKLVHWDLETDSEIRRLPGEQFAAIAPDGKTCFGAQFTNRWYRWDLGSGKDLDAVDDPTEPPMFMAFSPDGKFVATSDYGNLHVWDRATGKRLHHLQNVGYRGKGLFFTPDGASLVYGHDLFRSPKSGGFINKFFALDTGTWKQTEREMEDVSPNGMGPCLLSPDGKVLAGTIMYQPGIKLWDWASGKRIGKLDHADLLDIGPMAFSPDSKRLACLTKTENRVQVWNLVDRKLLAEWKTLASVFSLQFIEDGEFLAGWQGGLSWQPRPGDDPLVGNVRIWNPANGKERVHIKFPQNNNSGYLPQVSPDGKLVATANLYDSLVVFREVATGKEVGHFRVPVGGVYFMAFSPDGRFLAVSAEDTTVLLVDVRKVTGKP